jgi:hypothetical protein
MSRRRVEPGAFYRRTDDGGAMVPAAPGVPDVVICRRVRDYPSGAIPAGGTVTRCASCGAAVVTNMAKFPEQPRRCMQCSGIAPLPFEATH